MKEHNQICIQARETNTDLVAPEIWFDHLAGKKKAATFPIWRYHKFLEPLLVNNKEEDEQAKKDGYKPLKAGPISRAVDFLNVMHDLELMNATQLVAYIKAEFNLKLDAEVGREKLFKIIWKLTHSKPENQDRIVLLAQSIEMEYEATQEEIKRMIAVKGKEHIYERETITEVFYA